MHPIEYRQSFRVRRGSHNLSINRAAKDVHEVHHVLSEIRQVQPLTVQTA